MTLKKILILFYVLFVYTLNAQEDSSLKVNFESFTLLNGLTVIMHTDHSDPVVAVALTAHVGSAREKENRTGFAHLFEHLLFLESENLGKGGLDKMSARIGGSGANGSTSRDRTNFFQTVPKDALEKMIWAEADKLGFFINTVTKPVLAKEKQVVKNEKRQSYDNRPYGHTMYVIDKNLYPKDHPYNWQVIGSLEDLQNATLQDVKDFYNQWYVPNNVILTIAGDFDKEKAKQWVHKYFDEIPSGEEIKRQEKQLVDLEETKKLYYEDNFARLPELTMAWPSVYSYHEDFYALSILAEYLSSGKNAPLYKKLVEEKEFTGSVNMYNYSSELAGELLLQVRAYEGKDLDSVAAAIEETFAEFAKNGISDKDLKRIKAGQETSFYNSISSVLGKGFQLAQYQIFANDPNFINKEMNKLLAVSKEDVMQVFNKYIKDQNYVATSFVPKGQKTLALENSKPAEIDEEKIVEGAEEDFDASQQADYEKTPSSFDRSLEPPYAATPQLTTPAVWKDFMPSGMQVYGITNSEVPLVKFEFQLEGGLLLENPNKTGVSNLLAEILGEGTANKTPEELEEAIALLGAHIRINSSKTQISVSGSTLAKNFTETIALVEEILLRPRWDEEEFKLAKQQVLNQLEEEKANPDVIANMEFQKLIYGERNILSKNILGTKSSVEDINIKDLKDYYQENLTPQRTKFLVVGAVDKSQATDALKSISANWPAKNVQLPRITKPELPKKSKVYFYDIPGAKQSVFRFGSPAMAATSKDFYPAEVMNYRLGGGSFASQLTQQLREGKGYTYGIRSGFFGDKYAGSFMISTGVRTNITDDAAKLVKNILQNYPENFNQYDLEVTKSYMIKSNMRKFETLDAKLNMLSEISNYDRDYDYIKQREELVNKLDILNIQDLAKKYINPNRMYYLIVGDAKTQLDKLGQLGFGNPILLNPEQE